MKKTPMTDFGKDHWSLFGYIECRCADDKGTLDPRRMRANEKTHLLRNVNGFPWKNEWGTRLKGFFGEPGHKNNEDRRLPRHDDWDCLDDFEAAGLIEWHGTGMNPIIKLTKLGWMVAQALRQFKASGGNYAEFESNLTETK